MISLLRKPLLTACALRMDEEVIFRTVTSGMNLLLVEDVSGEVPSKVYQIVALSVAEARVTVCCKVKGPPGGVAWGTSAFGIGFWSVYCFISVSLLTMPGFLAMAL